jgi:uncharacterized protein
VKIIVAGGSGWIGSGLCPALVADGHDVVILSRSPQPGGHARTVVWDAQTLGPWTEELADADAVVNLCGESIGAGRWTAARKARLLSSRVGPTSLLVRALRDAPQHQRVLVNASAVGYYGDRADEPLTERETPGLDFLAQLVVQWEAAALAAESHGVRVVLLRNGVVLGPGGGALRQLALPFRLLVGGPLGRPDAWFPWVHIDDVVGLYRRALEDHKVDGPLNMVAGSVRMRELAREIGQALHRPAWLPVPRLALRLALGELGDAFTVSQHVLPERALALGYQFQEPGIARALERSL